MSELEDQSDIGRLVQMALQSNHIRKDPSLTSPFHCNICMVPFSGLEPLHQHLVSKKHKKKAAQRDSVAAVMSPSSPETSLLEDDHIVNQSQETFVGRETLQFSEDVKEALEKGHIVEDKGSITSPYQCKLCCIAVSGLEPLKQHVKSAKHIKKASAGSISFGISSATNVPHGESHNMIKDAINKDHVLENLRNLTSPYQCKLCHVPLTGLAPLEEHLKSAKHIVKTKETHIQTDSPACSFDTTNIEMSPPQHHYAQPVNHNSSQETGVGNETDVVEKSFELGHVKCDSGSSVAPYFCNICQVPLSGEDPLRQHVNSLKHAKKLRNKDGAFDMSRLKIALSNIDITEEVSPIVKKAIEEGHVCKDESSSAGAYFCNICQVPLTGVKPVEQHLQGSSHLGRTLQNDNFPKLPVKLPAFPKTIDTPSTPEVPISAQYKVILCDHPEEPDERTYKNLSKPRGHVYIFNNTFANDQKNFRPGADYDSINLKHLFEKMGYRVYINKDLSRDETLTKLGEIQKEKELEEVDSFIMVLLSHGKDSKEFHASDLELIHIDEIRYKFIDGKCPQLKGEPKIFMCNYCRGIIEQKQLQTDAPHNHSGNEAPTDMLTLHASIDGFKAMRDPSKGTIFVQSLCETLSKYAHNTEIRYLYHFLSELMREKLGTTPESQEYGIFKKFYFNPTSME